MAPFSVVKSEVVSFFVIKWPPNLIGIATLKGNNGPESDEKLVPNIIDKNILRRVSSKMGIQEVTAHRFRHTFAVALLNYGMRESALQKLMGHATLGMTLEYARILDQTVEHSFTQLLIRCRMDHTVGYRISFSKKTTPFLWKVMR